MSFFFTQKTAYEMRISDWSSDVCSSDLRADQQAIVETGVEQLHRARGRRAWARFEFDPRDETDGTNVDDMARALQAVRGVLPISRQFVGAVEQAIAGAKIEGREPGRAGQRVTRLGIAVETLRSEEHTSELKSQMRTSSVGF